MMAMELDDKTLIVKLRAGDESALEGLMTQYQTKVFGLSLRLTGNRQDAEEVLQDVFLTVMRKIHTFRGEAKLSSWIYRVTTNTALMKLRKRPKVAPIPLAEELGPEMSEEGVVGKPLPDWSKLPSDELQKKELLARIEEALMKLPAEYRSVFVLRDVEGFSASEACEVLEISLAALKSRLHRARLFMRKELAGFVASQVPTLRGN